VIAVLPILFLLVACLYSMAGFGGGSTYIALLAVSGLPLTVVPIISLTCNLIVTSQGSLLLIRRGHAQWGLLAPLLAGSIPCAFIGGAWRLPQETFILILSVALTVAGVAMLLQGSLRGEEREDAGQPAALKLLSVGACLGFLAGITGIGGGIYLAPVMHLLRWGRAHAIAACTSLFIALNSIAGLTGQLTKGVAPFDAVPMWILLGCPAAVLIGGRIGTHLLTEKLPRAKVRLVTACVILLVAIRLWSKALGT
jgi:hypothetical protein